MNEVVPRKCLGCAMGENEYNDGAAAAAVFAVHVIQGVSLQKRLGLTLGYMPHMGLEAALRTSHWLGSSRQSQCMECVSV